MSRAEEHGPLVASGEQIEQREFATIRRGYDPDQVRAYLASVAAHVEELERSLADRQARVTELEAAAPAATTDPHELLSKRYAGVLANADTEADEIVDQARDEAARIRGEARMHAEEVRMRGARSLIAAQEESDRMLEGLAERREAMLRQLHDMQSRLLTVADELEVAIQRDDRSEPVPARTEPSEAVRLPDEVAEHGSKSAPDPPPEPLLESPPPGAREAAVTPGASAQPVEVDSGLDALFDDPADEEPELPDFDFDIDLDLDLDDGRGVGR